MLSLFFINRPIFSWVVAILIMGAGALALVGLPIQPYPEIAPPEVVVSATYPGASAETLDKTVTQLIEQNLRGIDNLRYFSSESSSSGNALIRLTFETGTNADIAQVQTQNKISQALPRLPSQVQQLGIAVEKSNQTNSLIAAFYSPSGKVNQDDIADYISSTVVEPVSRVEGVGQITPFAPQHSMRIWLNPDKLFKYRLTSLEVISAIRDQNNQLSSGELGGSPASTGQQINASISSQTLLTNEEQFRKIILKTLPGGETVNLGDVARVEIGAENYASLRRFNRQVAAGFGVSLVNDANALDAIAAIKERVDDFKASFPGDVKVSYPVDVAPFIEVSVNEVVKTLLIAMVLVIVVMYIFLQKLRATLIPGIAIPVVLLGTVAMLSAFNYSINILTLFALVLSIGLLVDDAIIVTENVMRSIQEHDLEPKEAARKSMKQLWGALVGTTVVLWAVFIPMAFFGGSTGVIYRQFAVTLLSSMTISLFIALTFAPALCGSVLKKSSQKKEALFFRWFNSSYSKVATLYDSAVVKVLKYSKISVLTFILIVASTVLVFFRLPEAFLPDEDQGRIFTIVNGPANATFERMQDSILKVEDFFLDEASGAVDSLFTVLGFSFSGRGQNTGTAFVNLKPYEERTGEVTSVFDVAQMATKSFAKLRDASITAITPPAISQLGNARGFEFQLVDQGGVGREKLIEAKDLILKLAAADPKISYARLNALEDVPQYKFDIDYNKALALGLSVTDINATLSAAWGNFYVNDFIENNRVKRVFIQGEAPYRMNPEDISKWFIRNRFGEMVSFADIAKGSWTYGPPQVQRFNGFPSFEIQGESAPGASTGDAIEVIAQIQKKLPKGISLSWTGLSYEEREAGGQVFALYSLSIIAIFLCLAALYESWAIPFSIITVLPLGVFGAALFVWIGNLSNDIYFKVGILLTMALAAKNAILIIEFARQEVEDGKDILTAAKDAAKQRFRPILMTSFTFLLGILPLVLARGPGSGAQNAIGTSLLGGITSTTILIIFFAPLFFVLVLKLKRRFGR